METRNVVSLLLACLMLSMAFGAPEAAAADAQLAAQGTWLYCHLSYETNASSPGGLFLDFIGTMDTKFPSKDSDLSDTTTSAPLTIHTINMPLNPALSGDLKLDKSQDCIVNVYLSPGAFGLPGGYGPQEHVSVKLMSGQTVIGSGEQTQDVGPAAPGLTGAPGTKYEVKFKPSVDTIAAKDNIVLSVVVDTAGTGESVGTFAFATGKDYPWGVFLPVLNPFSMETFCYFENNSAIVSSLIRDPFGAKDVDVKSVSVSVEGPSEPEEANITAAVVQLDGGNFTKLDWVWKYKEEGAAPGEYKVTLSAKNIQGVEVANTTYFTITKNGAYTGASGNAGTKNAPGFEMLGLLAAVGAAVALLGCSRQKANR